MHKLCAHIIKKTCLKKQAVCPFFVGNYDASAESREVCLLKERASSSLVLEGWARRALEHQTDNGTRRMSQQVSATHNPKRQCVPMVGNVSESIQHNVDRDDGCGDSLIRWRRRRLADVFRLESRAHFGIRSHARQQRSAQVTCCHCSVNQFGADGSCVDHGWFVLSLGCHPSLLGQIENRPHGNTRQARPVDASTENHLTPALANRTKSFWKAFCSATRQGVHGSVGLQGGSSATIHGPSDRTSCTLIENLTFHFFLLAFSFSSNLLSLCHFLQTSKPFLHGFFFSWMEPRFLAVCRKQLRNPQLRNPPSVFSIHSFF